MFVGCCDIGLHIFVCDIVFTCSNVIILKNASAYSYYRAVDKRQAAMGKRSIGYEDNSSKTNNARKACEDL